MRDTGGGGAHVDNVGGREQGRHFARDAFRKVVEAAESDQKYLCGELAAGVEVALKDF
jgi:hypothetical protein